jgi:hypothetical protein
MMHNVAPFREMFGRYIFGGILDRHPRLRIVAVEGPGAHGSLWRMRPHRTRLDTLWPERIVAELLGDA